MTWQMPLPCTNMTTYLSGWLLASRASLCVALCSAQVGLFYGLTQPYGETQQRTEPKCSTHTQAKPTAAAVPGTLGAQHHVGPHLSCKGRFSGRVLVVPASRWTAADALQDFAAAAGAGVHWHASCKRGRLKLVAARKPAVKAAAAAAVEQEPAASTAARGARPDKVNLCA